MSWDVLLVNSRTPLDLDADNCPDFPPRTDFIHKVNQTFPGVDWSDPSLGILDSDRVVMEINVGDEEEIGSTVLLNVYGGEDPVGAVVALCTQHGWQAFDLTLDSYLDLNNPSTEGWNHFQESRGQIDE